MSLPDFRFVLAYITIPFNRNHIKSWIIFIYVLVYQSFIDNSLSILEIAIVWFDPNNLLLQFAFTIGNGTFYQLYNCCNNNDYFIGLLYCELYGVMVQLFVFCKECYTKFQEVKIQNKIIKNFHKKMYFFPQTINQRLNVHLHPFGNILIYSVLFIIIYFLISTIS